LNSFEGQGSFGFTLCIILENHNLFHHRIFRVKPSIAMPLLKLPNELLLMIANYIIDDYDHDGDESGFAHLNSFHQVNSRLYLCLNAILWQKATDAGYIIEERVLAHSINTNNLERLKFFLSLGADVETLLRTVELTEGIGGQCLTHIWNPTPLIVAAYLDNVTMARLFLEKGAKVQYSLDDRDDEPCYHAMHAARSAEMVQLLLDHGAHPELSDSLGDRPLHCYVRRNDTAAMRTILQRGANVDSASEASASRRTPGPDRTPLYEAVQRRRMDAVKILLEFGADVKKGDLMMNTPLHAAVWSEDMELVRLLLERWPEGVRAHNWVLTTPLHAAAERGKTDMVRLFLGHFPEGLRVKNGYGNTPLHAAAVVGVEKGMLDVFKLLVDSWPDGRWAVNRDEKTPLQAFQSNTLYRKYSLTERRAIIALLSGVC
jgi:ankyrin repeat protein